VVSALRQVSADTATEVLVELKPPPQRLFADAESVTGRANYFAPAFARTGHLPLLPRQARGKIRRRQKELYLSEERSGDETPTRGSRDAMAGTARSSPGRPVEAAWAVVDPVSNPYRVRLTTRQLGAERG